MKLDDIAQHSQLPTTVGEYITQYKVKTGPFLTLTFSHPNNISSWEGTPNMLLYFSPANTNLTNLEGLELLYVQTFDARKSNVKDFHNFHEHIRRCDFLYAYENTANMLGVLLSVTRLTEKEMFSRISIANHDDSNNHKLSQVFNELLSLDDISEAQERMIRLGLEKQAGI